MSSTKALFIRLPESLDLQAGDEFLVPTSYRVTAEDATLEQAGCGGVVLFDTARRYAFRVWTQRTVTAR